jgi:tetratricopeptide (TPR) repeat protein
LSYIDKSIEAFEPSEMHGERFRLGPHSGVIALTSSAFFLTWQGYPDQARARAARALVDAEELGHSYSIAYAHFHVAFFSLIYRDIEAVAENATRLLALANQYDYQIWRALALVLLGVVEAFTGDPAKAVVELEKGIELYRRLPTPPVFWAMLLQLRAPVAAMAGDIDRGLELIDQAIELEPDPATPLLAEVLITKGDVLVMGGREPESLETFTKALENATTHGTRLSALRSLTRLVRGGGEAHRGQLTDMYESFTEGFDIPDLVEAREVLDS